MDGQSMGELDRERLRVALAVHTAWPFGVSDDPQRVGEVLDIYGWLGHAGHDLGEPLADLVHAWEAYEWERGLAG